MDRFKQHDFELRDLETEVRDHRLGLREGQDVILELNTTLMLMLMLELDFDFDCFAYYEADGRDETRYLFLCSLYIFTLPYLTVAYLNKHFLFLFILLYCTIYKSLSLSLSLTPRPTVLWRIIYKISSISSGIAVWYDLIWLGMFYARPA